MTVSEPETPKVATLRTPVDVNKPRETPSIFGRKKEKVESEQEKQTILDKAAEPFTAEELQAAWHRFGTEKSNVGDTDRLILNRELEKGKEHSVVIHLASQLEVSFLEKLEVELIQFLRAALKNDHITLTREIKQEQESKKLYTSKDIYEHMVKENPQLKELKDRLGLDFDY